MDSDLPSPPRRPRVVHVPPLRIPRAVGLALLIPLAALLVGAYVWFVQRVEVGPNEVLVLVRKWGARLPSSAEGQVVLYPSLLKEIGEGARPAGIVYEPLTEGRHFCDPLFWERITVPVTLIAQDEVGIKVRRYGRPLAAGKIVATEPDERGPLPDVLKPGRYAINTLAYDVKRFRPIFVPAGHVGVRTLLWGETNAQPNEFLAAAGQRGTQSDVVVPGMYYVNPYVEQIDVIDVRSHTLDLREADSIRFPSNDSFEILVEATIEYAIREDRAAYVMVAIGDHDEIKDRIILPYAQSFSRIEGSKLSARDFIAGETRTAFQKRVFDQLREQCFEQGIEIRAALIRRIVPPPEIADPISDRQIADQQIRQYEQEIKVAESEAQLVKEQELQKQKQAIGVANKAVVATVKEAEQAKSVALTAARQKLEVAKLGLQAATETAAALLSRGEAEADVVRLGFEAEAIPLRQAVAAFGDGETYARFHFYQQLAPAVRSVLASTDGPFAEIFKQLNGSTPTTADGASGGAATPRVAESPKTPAKGAQP
ncbi:MAG: hypothetical protein CHACPFDD_00059 [Phycisphaerae bacterium]|nr:hypothetical protein [Phycisphaerae bacterium]